ncbi:TPA: protein mom [Escherichia coli]|nr:protein mom [Escherichia coli]
MAQKVSRVLSPRGVIKDQNDIVGYGCTELRVEIISCWLARSIIQDKHYSRRFVNNSYLHLGVFAGRNLVGVLQFGYALNPNSGARVVLGTGNREYMELNRMWIHDSQPRNTESRVLAYSLKLISILYPQVKWVQTFADERCGRSGVVYQAANFDYIGSHFSTFYELDGEFYHEICRTALVRGGKRGEYLRANLDKATRHRYKQFRYIRFLDKRARQHLNSKLFRVQAYPK